MTSAQMDLVDQVGAAVNAVDDPKALRKRIVAELRAHYADSVPAGAKTDDAVYVAVLRANPDLIERIRTQVFAHQDLVVPLEAVVAEAMSATFACLDITVTQAMGTRYTVRWAAGSREVKGLGDGRRWRVEWGTDQTAADLTELG